MTSTSRHTPCRIVLMPAFMVSYCTMVYADSGAANSMAREIGSTIMPFASIALRVFGGVLAVVGVIMTVIKLADQSEGMDKIMKICAFAVIFGFGLYLLLGTEHFIRTIGLYNAFPAQPVIQAPDYSYYPQQ